jgi:hypothetical protein
VKESLLLLLLKLLSSESELKSELELSEDSKSLDPLAGVKPESESADFSLKKSLDPDEELNSFSASWYAGRYGNTGSSYTGCSE